MGLSLKPNHHNQIKLVQIPDTHCIKTEKITHVNFHLHNFLVILLLEPQLIYLFVLVQSPPRIIKQPPTDELLFQVKSRADENDKPFIIECEADGEPAPT